MMRTKAPNKVIGVITCLDRRIPPKHLLG